MRESDEQPATIRNSLVRECEFQNARNVLASDRRAERAFGFA